MLKSLVPAVAIVALAFSSAPATLWAADASPSPAVAKVLGPAQDDFKAKKYAEAISKAKEALTVSGKTPYDTYATYRLMRQAYDLQGNKAEQLTAWQGMLDSGHPSPAEQNEITKYMFLTAAGLKNYPQAIEYGNRLIRSGTADASTYNLIADSLDKQGKSAEALKFLSDYVATLERGGQKPREENLLQLRAWQDKQGNKAAAADTVEKLVVHYGKPEYWKLALYGLSREPKLNERQRMNLYRLKLATRTLERCEDFTEMADVAINTGIAGEGQRIIEQGISGKACPEKAAQEKLQRLQAQAGREIAADKARLGKLEADAKASKTGELDVEWASAEFGYGEYAKAIEGLSRGLAKGGLKYPADAQVLLGIAQVRAGNKPEALKTFQAIKTTDPLTQRVVKYWTLFVGGKSGLN